jgi:hypothetical protein
MDWMNARPRAGAVWIGWHPDEFLARIKAHPTATIANWLVKIVNSAINEIYVDDLFEDRLLAPRHLVKPDQDVIGRLLKESGEQRRLHHRYVRSRDHKGIRSDLPPAEYWAARARTHLFRSKRTLALASYLRARIVLNEHFGRLPSAEKLAKLAGTWAGSDAIRRIVKKAKADRIGIAVADVTVCGAVQPYNALLGGKPAR